MGILADSLKRPSAYSVKKTDLYAEIKDRIDGAVLLRQLLEIEEWLDANDHALPSGWRDCFDNLIILKREELESEDVGKIVREKYDF